MKKTTVTRTDIILALKVICLITECGVYVPTSALARDEKVVGLLVNVYPESDFKMDKKTAELVLHLRNFFDNVSQTGSSFIQHLDRVIWEEWNKCRKPPMHVRFGFRIAILWIYAGRHPDDGLVKGFGTKDLVELSRNVKITRGSWEYLIFLNAAGANIAEYFKFLAGEKEL